MDIFFQTAADCLKLDINHYSQSAVIQVNVDIKIKSKERVRSFATLHIYVAVAFACCNFSLFLA